MGLDDRVVSRKPHPSHLADDGPREWPLVSLIPFLDSLRENVGGEIRVDGFVVINSPWISEKRVVGHVLAD